MNQNNHRINSSPNATPHISLNISPANTRNMQNTFNQNNSQSNPLQKKTSQLNSSYQYHQIQNNTKAISPITNSHLNNKDLDQSLATFVGNKESNNSPVIESRLFVRTKQKPHPQTISTKVVTANLEKNNQNQYQEYSQNTQHRDTQKQISQYQPLSQPSTNQITEKTEELQELPINVSTTEEHIISASDLPEQGHSNKSNRNKRQGLKIFLVLILLFLTGIITSAGFIYAVAYEKIDIKNYSLQRKIAHFVINYIPLAPITPQYIIEKTALAHKNITKTSYDLSLAINTDQGLTTDFGFDNFDMKTAGAIDLTNPNNILATADLSITNQFDIQFKTKDNILYFKVSKFPTQIFTLLNVDPESFNPLINQWIRYDTKTLNTEARTFLDREMLLQEEKSSNQEINKLGKMFDKKLLENITVNEEIYNGYNSYKLEFVAESDMIDYIVENTAKSQSQDNLHYNDYEYQVKEKPSDFIKELKVFAWVQKDTFYIRKILLYSTIVTDETNFDLSIPYGLFPGSNGEQTKITITGAMLLDNFNKEVIIQIPENALETEEVYIIFSKAIYGDSYMSKPFVQFPEDSLYEFGATSEAELELSYHKFESISDVLSWADESLKKDQQNAIP